MDKQKSPVRVTKESLWTSLRRSLGRFRLSRRKENLLLRQQVIEQERQIRMLNNLLGSERKRSAQLTLLSEVEQHLKSVLDQPVAAQLVVNTIHRTLSTGLTSVLLYDDENDEFTALAVAGRTKAFPPPSYRQRVDQGLIGRAARQRKTLIVNDTSKEPDFIPIEGRVYLSEIVIPLLQHGRIRGVLVVDDEKCAAFSTADVATLEIIAGQLLNAWERSSYHERLTLLIQEGAKLPTLVEPQAVMESIARIAREILEARFVFVSLLDQEGSFTRTAHAGNAPQVLRSLNRSPESDPLIQAVLKNAHTLHLRDLRQSNLTNHLHSEHSALKNLLAFPIRLHDMNIGVVLIFGKRDQSVFSENDESLADLIATQAAASIESAWLYQELRSTLQTATQLYQLSTCIMQAEDLAHAAKAIANTALRLGEAQQTGIVLYTPEGEVQAQVQVEAEGIQPGATHPYQLIEQALQTGQTIIVSDEKFATRICVPLQTPLRTYGALWIEIPASRWYTARYSANLQALTNQATVALERSILLAQTREQAHQLEEAFHELEQTYDKTLTTLITALDARDRETEGHSTRVSAVACRLAQELSLTSHEVKTLERGSLLHDIGKIGVSDAILLKPGPLTEDEWQMMRQHPEIGAHIVGEVPFLADILPIVRHHHEHWDGSGYPDGLAQHEIPLMARIFSVADAFDAIISDRPYRKGLTEKYAIEYLQSQAGLLYDPEIAAVFTNMLADGRFKDILRQL